MDTWEMVAAERNELAELMDGFSDADWAAASLCDGWTVRMVAGHLIGWFERSLPTMLLKVLRMRSFDRTVDFFARVDAALPVEQIIAELRANAGNRFKPPFALPEQALMEVLVHGLDICCPLGLPTGRPEDRVNRVLDFLTTRQAARAAVPKGLFDGLKVSTTDSDWTHGQGAELTGPAASLTLALMGRPAGLERLTGRGVDMLRSRLMASVKNEGS